MGWTEQVAHMRKCEMHTKFSSKKLKGRDHLEDLSVDGRIILKLILVKQGVVVWT